MKISFLSEFSLWLIRTRLGVWIAAHIQKNKKKKRISWLKWRTAYTIDLLRDELTAAFRFLKLAQHLSPEEQAIVAEVMREYGFTQRELHACRAKYDKYFAHEQAANEAHFEEDIEMKHDPFI